MASGDNWERIDAAELIRRHRASRASQGDIVRAIATVEERLIALEHHVIDLTVRLESRLNVDEEKP